MSKDIENIMKEVIKSNKEIHNTDHSISLDIIDLKKGIKNIENKIKSMDDTLTKLFDIMNTIIILIEESDNYEEVDEDSDKEEWNPYNDENFSYEENDDGDDDTYFQDYENN
jgi:hypothetical protein